MEETQQIERVFSSEFKQEFRAYGVESGEKWADEAEHDGSRQAESSLYPAKRKAED